MSEATTHSETGRTPSLVWFFVATFGVTWFFWVPGVVLFGPGLSGLTPWSPLLFIVLQTLGAAGPSVVAYWLLRRSGQHTAIKSITQRYTLWRIALPWYLVAALLVPVIQLAGLFVGGVLTGSEVVDPASPLGEMLGDLGIAGVVAMFPLIIVAQLPSSPLLEEFGWRGFALPRLQDRYSALTSSVILGVLWGLWHLPIALAYGDSLLSLLLQITAVSVLMTWVFNSTGGSMLLAMLCHASLNASIVPFASDAGRWPGTLLMIAVALAVILLRGPRDLSSQPRFRWSSPGAARARSD